MAAVSTKLSNSMISLSGSNCTLSYGYGYIDTTSPSGRKASSHQTATANLRCTRIAMNYGVISTESHARRQRAFYPHRRSQGGFDLTFVFNGWREHQQGQKWFQSFCDAVLSNQQPSVVYIHVPSRNFMRYGVLTKGIVYGDHKGSMVFAPVLSFISITNKMSTDPGVTDPNSGSSYEHGDKLSTQWFYPNSKINEPGALQKWLFDNPPAPVAVVPPKLPTPVPGLDHFTPVAPGLGSLANLPPALVDAQAATQESN